MPNLFAKNSYHEWVQPLQNDAKNPEKLLKPWTMGTHLRVLSKSYQMNTKMTGSRCFSKILHHCASYLFEDKAASMEVNSLLREYVYVNGGI